MPHKKYSHLLKNAAKSKEELAAADIVLWKKWKYGGKQKDDLRNVMGNLKGVVRSQANYWAKRADMPPAAVHQEFYKQAVDALDSYNPNKGSKVSTWVTNRMKKAQRFVSTYQDPSRIGERRYYMIGQYENSKSNLTDQLNREPTSTEIADYMQKPLKDIVTLEKEKRKDLYTSSFGESGWDPTTHEPSQIAQVLRYIPHELNRVDELPVFEYTYGHNGKPKLQPSQIAKKLGFSPSKVTNIRKRIEAKIEKFLV